ncbi:MAG: glycine cleavage system protein GcvH [Candidatus Woesearchaeota archaeon]|jgi:glycine cleavage system H protein|nr:glycine cleavage system protein GcvH [Candidatus Woesearchaeota archaeon]
MENPTDRKYSKEHEWAKLEGDIVVCGITDFAQSQLTDIVFVELPEKGKQIEKGKQAGVVESVKSVSDIFVPVGGEIVEVNEEIVNNPDIINKTPFNEGWMFKIKVKDKAELDSLMSAEEYTNMTKEDKH